MSVARNIFRAIHEGRWLSIEYVNAEKKTTHYWISINNIEIKNKDGVERARLDTMGLHLMTHECSQRYLYFDGIQYAEIIEGTFALRNTTLLHDLNANPSRYACIFSNVHNVKILNYLQECQKLSCDNREKKFRLLEHLDESQFVKGCYKLTQEECDSLIEYFQKKQSKKSNSEFIALEQLGLNKLSIKTDKGLYVLAYNELLFDIENKALRKSPEPKILTRFVLRNDVATEVIRISRYLHEDEFLLLENFDANEKQIKDLIIKNGRLSRGELLDDMPHIVALETTSNDLTNEYDSIALSLQSGSVTTPLRAFFGEFLSRSRKRKNYPIALLDNNVNLDQLLAIHKTLKYPMAYIQGPPGTGKTRTIVNTIISAFFNDCTVLFSSQNNQPVDGAFKQLISITVDGKDVPFPILRLGNNEEVKKSIGYIKGLFERTKNWTVKDEALTIFSNEKTENTSKLAEYLETYEDKLDLLEREDAVNDFLEKNTAFDIGINLQSKQLTRIRSKLADIGEVNTEKALSYLPNDYEKFLFFIRFKSAKCIQRLKEPKYRELWKIIDCENADDAVAKFNRYLKEDANLENLLKVFPVVATTNQSAKKLGSAKVHFDITILDEASQCDMAMALLPILRSESLMLVGDPQQLNPVITLDDLDNKRLIKKYGIADEYDYKKNSIYKSYLAADSISDEVLLSHHYRSAKEIISFNNKKYYNNKLQVMTAKKELPPLIFQETANEKPFTRNTSANEADAIAEFVANHPEKSIGIITPFVAQKEMIDEALKNRGVSATCGTVHTFQGDEKDIILFSLALTQRTAQGTYNWFADNKELINVAVSRAKEELVLFSNTPTIERLHKDNDDLYELVQYVKTKGEYKVTPKHSHSRALGLKTYSTKMEDDFFENINHALSIVDPHKRYSVKTQVPVSQVFQQNTCGESIFFTGSFDFVLYEKDGRSEVPLLAIELDGEEHRTNENRKRCDAAKERICKSHYFKLLRIPNSYARRYNHIKEILIDYFKR
ncbi:AAA domain-containing protein [Fibrobacter sp. UWH6]|uniref:AAA domain-containing protein n=1 Tax=Fibrobacter sp. (strain UWH6) TaxID=1896212 RepID=UPI00091BA8C6|nr:AAA domain-containing protein [Fibrobacter sp. UWH6]SHL66124.1 Superfamily I DNA and/or RNA helicase [Fibrobacter sp. UWH6]